MYVGGGGGCFFVVVDLCLYQAFCLLLAGF